MSNQRYAQDSDDIFGQEDLYTQPQDQYTQQQDQQDPYAGEQDYSQGPSDAYGAQDPYTVDQGLEPEVQQQSSQGDIAQGPPDNLRQQAQGES